MGRFVWASLLLCAVARGGELRLDEVFDPYHPAFPDSGNRLDAKKGAFEAAVGREGLAAAARALRGCESAIAAIDKFIAKDAIAYDKSGDAYFGWRRKFEQDFRKRNGRPPSEVNVPQNLNDDFIAKEIALKKSLSFKRRERSFHDWAERRSGELLASAEGASRSRAISAFGAGLRDRSVEQRLRCAAVLGAAVKAEDEDAASALEAAFKSSREPVVAAAILEARCRAADPLALTLLEEAITHTAWRIRAGAVRALGRLATKEAVDLLLRRMPAERGRLLDDISSVLRRLTGQELGGDPAAWTQYWEGALESWSGPPAPQKTDPDEERLAPPAFHSDGPAAFMGIATRSDALLLCIDGSVESLWEVARTEAAALIEALPDRTRFNVIVYGEKSESWRRKMTDAIAGNRKSAVDWLARWTPEHGADACGALAGALEMAEREDDMDTIYFLTIAGPTRGHITDAPQMGQEIVARNRAVGVRIHAIGVSEPRDAYFLQEIARQFDGVFKSLR